LICNLRLEVHVEMTTTKPRASETEGQGALKFKIKAWAAQRQNAKAHRLKPVLPEPPSSTGFSLCGVLFPALSCDEGKQRDAENESRSSPKKQKETKPHSPTLENCEGSCTRKFKGWPTRFTLTSIGTLLHRRESSGSLRNAGESGRIANTPS